jgi:hypothetical protein
MGRPITSKLEVVGVGVRLVVGSFAPNGSSALATASNKGQGFSPAYTSTGLYTLTLRNKDVRSVLCYLGHVQSVSAAARFSQGGTINVAAGTIQVRTVDGSGVVQDMTANENSRVHFALFLATSTLND